MKVPLTPDRNSRDGSWFPIDHPTVLSRAITDEPVCYLRSLQPLDRSICRDSDSCEKWRAAARRRQKSKNVRFHMIVDNWDRRGCDIHIDPRLKRLICLGWLHDAKSVW
jgi:hypothetical protein